MAALTASTKQIGCGFGKRNLRRSIVEYCDCTKTPKIHNTKYANEILVIHVGKRNNNEKKNSNPKHWSVEIFLHYENHGPWNAQQMLHDSDKSCALLQSNFHE